MKELYSLFLAALIAAAATGQTGKVSDNLTLPSKLLKMDRKYAVHLDLITCAPIYNKENMGATLSKLFCTSSIEIRRIE